MYSATVIGPPRKFMMDAKCFSRPTKFFVAGFDPPCASSIWRNKPVRSIAISKSRRVLPSGSVTSSPVLPQPCTSTEPLPEVLGSSFDDDDDANRAPIGSVDSRRERVATYAGSTVHVRDTLLVPTRRPPANAAPKAARASRRNPPIRAAWKQQCSKFSVPSGFSRFWEIRLDG